MIPSSSFLTERMLRPIDWAGTRAIAELGAGTGVFTKAIHAQVRPGTKVAVFEKDEQMRGRLAEEYPEFSCFDNAGSLTGALRSMGLERVDCIVSGRRSRISPPSSGRRFLGRSRRRCVPAACSSLSNIRCK
ncbi:hypothetical protein LJK87_32575 [Paenibacillus sp. P25]|nr:hypothetical protein LJK87_32575 [Paenibacillus sp. P25]